MKLNKYLFDKRYLILFYFILMSFISSVIYLLPAAQVSPHNIIYINFVSLILFVLYLLGEYFSDKRHYNNINYIINNVKEDIINTLPEPKTYEQSLYDELLKHIYEEQNNKIEKLHREKKENLEYITSWVHEVKTPIAVSRLIIENSTNKPSYEIFNSLEEELDKIEAQVEQALYYSRIDAFSKDYFINEVNLEKIVNETVKKHAKTFINKKIKIEIEDLNLSVTTDKKWLIFILDQILCNSLKYTGKDGKIKITAQKDRSEKRLIIEDNGIGIKHEDIQRVFDKGFTGHTGRKNYQSTGMGLYLARRLAGKLGHDISVESVYGDFTRVIIHFPKLTDYFNVTRM